MEYKLIGLDLDGTLLNSKKKINKEVLDTIIQAENMGKHVSLSSGRALAEIKDYEEEFSHLEYAILESGGLVRNLKNNQNIYMANIEEDVANKIFDAATKKDCFIHIISEGRSLGTKEKVKNMAKYGMGPYQPMYNRVCTQVDDVVDFYRCNVCNIEKINIFHLTPKDREDTYAIIKNLPVTIAFAEETSIEISPLGVSKGKGLKVLCEHLGIDISETIAVGDADNDIEILKTAGLAIAMENANGNVKKIANVIVKDNDHNGVKEAIDKYLIG